GADSKKNARGRKTTVSQNTRIKAHLMSLMQRGFTRLYADGRIIELATPDSYTKSNFDDTFVLVDRLIAGPDVRARVVDSIEVCYQEGHGQAIIETTGGEESRRLKFSEGFECRQCFINSATT